MGEALILDARDTPDYADGWRIYDAAAKADEVGAGLAFVRSRRSLREFQEYLNSQRAFRKAQRTSRWCDPY
jgi:hypothetical protein